jgi:hypothetical protein
VSFVTNFTIIYIKMGFPRLPPSKAAEVNIKSQQKYLTVLHRLVIEPYL